jgi:hypothetical protein
MLSEVGTRWSDPAKGSDEKLAARGAIPDVCEVVDRCEGLSHLLV